MINLVAMVRRVRCAGAEMQARALPSAAETLSDLIAHLGLVGDGEVLAPVMAGVRARNVADGFELAGVGAILLDSTGGVLHVGACAKPFLTGALTVTGGHLLASTAKANRALEAFIASALSGSTDIDEVVIDQSGGAQLRLRAASLSQARHDPLQLLKAVIVVSHG